MLTLETTRYSAVIKAFMAHYPLAVVTINHKPPEGDIETWCTNSTLKFARDFLLTVEGRIILAFHDGPIDMWAVDDALPLVEKLAAEKLLHFSSARYVRGWLALLGFKDKNELQTIVQFRSDQFPMSIDSDDDGESDEFNPGRWGKLLAVYIRDGLARHGYDIKEEPMPEDWCWTFKVKKDDFDFWIECANERGYVDRFFCTMRPHKRYIRKFLFKQIDISEKLIDLKRAIDDILNQDPTIREKRWLRRSEWAEIRQKLLVKDK